MVIGVAFVAVPAQFGAPSLAREVGVDVTRLVFERFAAIEIGLGLVALALAALGRPPWLVWVLLGAIGTSLALQSLWLLPVLADRVALLLQGEALPPGPWHRLYALLVGVKLAALLVVAGRLLWGQARR
jgi:hypothetical protein